MVSRMSCSRFGIWVVCGWCWYLCFVFEGFDYFDEGACGVVPRGWRDEVADFFEFEAVVDELAVFGVADEAVLSSGP